MKIWLIRKCDSDGIMAQRLLQRTGVPFNVIVVSTGNGDVPSVLTEDGRTFEGFLRVKLFCANDARKIKASMA